MDHYRRHADIINRGFSGYNTRWCAHMLPDIFRIGDATAPPPPRLVTVFLGANDSALADVSPKQHVPLTEYAENLERIVAHVREQAAAAPGGARDVDVVLIAPPPIDGAARLVHQKAKYGDLATGVLERTNDNTAKYAEACRAVAAKLGVPVVDPFTTMQAARPDGTWTEFLSDGLHLSASGQEFLFTELMAVIADKLPHLQREALPKLFPEWDAVDPADSKASIDAVPRGAAGK